jgi:hypothetical protein
MKTITLILFLFPLTLVAQYESVIKEDSTYWVELNIMLTPEYTACMRDSVILKNDTIINGNKYHAIFSDYYNYTGFLKEDTVSGKIWFFKSAPPYHGDVNEEVLIMDLSLNLGDIFPIPIRAIQNNQIIDSFDVIVDSVYFVNNRKHIRFGNMTNDFTHEKLTFIEGVGTNFGFDYRYDTRNKILERQVKGNNINYLYEHSENNELCLEGGLGNQTLEKTNISVSPNPFETGIKLLSETLLLNVQLTDLQGNLIEFEQNNNYIHPLNCSPGVYILTFQIDNKTYFQKLIKE